LTSQEVCNKMKVGDLVFHKSYNHWGVGILFKAAPGHTYKIWWQKGFESIEHFYNLRLAKDDKDWRIVDSVEI